MKKLLAMVLSLVMISGMSLTAFAADTITSTEEGQNTASHDVTATYNSSSSGDEGGGSEEENKPVINGLSITIDGLGYNETNTTESNPATIYSNSTVAITVHGENFANLETTANARLAFTYFSGNITWLTTDNDAWTIDTTNNTASFVVDADTFDVFTQATSASELKYTNDGWATDTGSGVYVIYSNETTETPVAAITGVEIKVDDGEYSNTSINITPTSVVTIKVNGTNFNNFDGTQQLLISGDGGSETYIVSSENGWTIDAENGIATKQFVGTDFDGIQTLYYANSGENWTETGITITYETPDVISVTIDWGSLAFVYDDNSGWSCEDGANTITVTNNSTVGITAEATYSQSENYTNITGEFDVNSMPIYEGSFDFRLFLSGIPTESLSNTVIGSVTIKIIEID